MTVIEDLDAAAAEERRQYARDLAKIRAKATITFYLRRAFEAAGLEWTGDNGSEIDGLVEDLMEDGP